MRLTNVARVGDNTYKFAIRFNEESVLLGTTEMKEALGYQIIEYNPKTEVMLLKRDGKLYKLKKEKDVDPFEQ